MRRVAPFFLILLSATTLLAQTPASPALPATPAPPPPAAVGAAATANWPTAQFASSKDESVQKAYVLLNQTIRALGGDAYLNVQNMQTEGRTYGFYHGQPSGMGTVYWRFWQWPDKERIELTKQRDVTELFVGDKGYEITYKGTATQDPKDMDDYLRRRDHSLEWVLRHWLPAPKTMILYAGTAMVERNLADQVSVLNGDNDSVTISIDSTPAAGEGLLQLARSGRSPVRRRVHHLQQLQAGAGCADAVQHGAQSATAKCRTSASSLRRPTTPIWRRPCSKPKASPTTPANNRRSND